VQAGFFVTLVAIFSDHVKESKRKDRLYVWNRLRRLKPAIAESTYIPRTGGRGSRCGDLATSPHSA
jgi:hypothetical protein